MVAVTVRAASADAASAFEAIYREHAERVFALLTRLLGPDREREDLLQETFIRLHGALPRFRGDCSMTTFVYRITTRVAIDHMRRRRPLAASDFSDEVDAGLTPAEHVARCEQLARAVGLLAQLSPKHRVAFVLREVMGLSHEEIGTIVEAQPAAARMRVAKAKRVLAKLTAKEDR